MRSLRLAALCLATGLLATASVHADVIVLDMAGGGDAIELQPAIDLAQNGDFILVKPGFYFGPAGTGMVAGKSLTIVGDVGGLAQLNSLHVVGLAPNQSVTLRGLQLIDDMGLDGPALQVDGSAGVVFVEDCFIRGELAPTDLANSGVPGMPAVVLTDALKVSFHRTTLRGGDGADFTGLLGGVDQASLGGRGLMAIRSTVAAYDSSISAGSGGNNPVVNPPGVVTGGDDGVGGIECVLDFVGTTVMGGDGGNGCQVGQEGVCMGGAAVNLDPLSILRTMDSSLTPGLGGIIDGGGVAPPSAVVIGAGTVQNYPGTVFVQTIDSPLRPGQQGLFSLTGEPGSVFAQFISLSTDHLPLPSQGVFFLPVGPQLLGPFVVAGMPAGGAFIVPFTTPSLAGPGLTNLSVTVQSLAQDSAGRILFSSATKLLIVDGF